MYLLDLLLDLDVHALLEEPVAAQENNYRQQN